MNRIDVALVASAFALVACDMSVDVREAELTLLDTVRIAENDELFVGRPNAIAVGFDGTVYISDAADRVVKRVNRNGSELAVITRRGQGPGEIASPTSVAVIGDSILAINNVSATRIELFSIPDLDYRGSIPFQSTNGQVSVWNNSLLAASLDLENHTAFAILSRDTSVAMLRGGSVPGIYDRYPMLASAFGNLAVGRDDNSVVGVFEVSNTAFRWNITNATVDSVVLSVSVRRGARPELIEDIIRDPALGAKRAFDWSFPILAAPLTGNRTAVVFFDPVLQSSTYAGQSFLQVVDWERKASCRELPLPVPAETTPRFAMLGDTLVAVVQHADAESGASSWIVRWLIGQGACKGSS